MTLFDSAIEGLKWATAVHAHKGKFLKFRFTGKFQFQLRMRT